ncbi:MAG: OmpA family protein, partial [Bdellovibrionales bacterium]|nr:OmpA family protein [Bdellovibrionales bacterium]
PIKQKVEGTMTTIRYYYKNAEQQASPLEIIRNYQNAVKNFGGTVLYERLPQEMDGGETTLQATAAGKLHWIKVEPDIYSAPTQSYKLQIVEVQEMKQFISANDYMNELKEKGFVTLYINFDTGKWDLKSDSDVIIKELVTMLQSDSNLKLSIEGHTDNIGSPESNISLSQNRARSVMEALIKGGISQERLTSTGFGQEKPIADNRTEDGRAKNRRVELIKVE